MDRTRIGGILNVCTDYSVGQLSDLIWIVSYTFLSHKYVSLLKVRDTRGLKFWQWWCGGFQTSCTWYCAVRQVVPEILKVI